MSASPAETYFDVHDILAGETPIPATLRVPIKACGFALDPSSDYADLPAGAALELPLWLLSCFTAEDWAAVKLPRCFSRKMQRKMDMGACCEDLRLRCPYFYRVALQLHECVYNEHLVPFVDRTFKARYKELLTRAHTTDTGPGMALVQALLCEEEMQLFDAGRASVKATEAWRYSASAPGRSLIGAKRRLESTSI